MRKFILIFLFLLITAQFATAELTKDDWKEIEKLLEKQKEEIKSIQRLKHLIQKLTNLMPKSIHLIRNSKQSTRE